MADQKASAFGVVTTVGSGDYIPAITGIGSTPTNSVITKANLKTDLGYTKSDVGLSNVDNTADTAKTVAAANALKSATTTVNTSSATAPTSGQVLTATSSTAATWQTPSGGGGSSTPRVTYSIATTGPTTNAVVSTASGASLSVNTGTATDLRRGTTPGGSIWFNFENGSALLPIYDKNPIFSTVFTDGDATSGQNYSTYVTLDYAGDGTSALPAAGNKFIGFNLTGTGTTRNCYSVHCDGTHAEVRTDISSSMSFGANAHVLTAVMTSATDIKFYVNGTLAATHTTDLPSGTPGGSFIFMSIAARGSAGSTNVSMGQVGSMYISHNAY